MVASPEPDLFTFGALRPGDLVLDAAGGKGKTAAGLVAAGARVVLLDRSAEVLSAVEPGLRARIGVVRGDALSLPFPAAAFDAVVLRAVVHHLVEPATALREAARAVRPGGVVLVVDKAGPEDLEHRALRNAIERMRHGGHVWAYGVGELRNLAGAARLDLEAAEEWSEDREAGEWLEGGTADGEWKARIREYLEADAAAGGPALGTRREGGRLVMTHRWATLRLRKSGGTR